MTIAPVLFSSDSEEWATPRALFERLDRRYHFTLDPCATHEKALVPGLLHPRGRWAQAGLGNASRILQSALWPTDGRMGDEVFRVSAARLESIIMKGEPWRSESIILPPNLGRYPI